MRQKQTLLGIFAHPDDESFGPGGTLARYAAQDVHVHIIIATDGIAGSTEDQKGDENDHEGDDSRGPENLAQVRSKELSDAAVALGLTSIHSLPFRDSGMRDTPENQHPDALIQQPIEQLTAEIAEYMRRLQPQVILTHDPYGGYGHPDHVRCCEATTAAFHTLRLAGQYSNKDNIQSAKNNIEDIATENRYIPQKLYYTAFDRRILRFIVRAMPLLGQDPTAVGRNKDINLVEISRWETPIHARIDISDYLDHKRAASEAHVSQYSGGPGFVRFLPPILRRRFMNSEAFTRAYPGPTLQVENDLFLGVKTEDGYN